MALGTIIIMALIIESSFIVMSLSLSSANALTEAIPVARDMWTRNSTDGGFIMILE
jgi:hypothetical protein